MKYQYEFKQEEKINLFVIQKLFTPPLYNKNKMK